jgi:parvulin-like peptidyl-prolyl isomerase
MKGEYAMRLLIITILSGAIIGFSLSCTKTDNKVAARVGKDAITVKMIKDQYLAITPAARADLKTIDEKEAFAKDIVSKEILKLEALKMGLDRLPEVTRAGQSALTRQAWQSFYEEQVRSQAKITDQELQALYAKQRTTYHLAWILVRAKMLADELVRRVQNGEDFGKIASTYSIDPSRTQNGDTGFRSLGTMPAAVEEKIMAMSPGETSGVIPYEDYYVILKLIEKKEQEPAPFEQSREGLEAMLRVDKETAKQRELAREIKKAYDLTFNQGAVDLIVSKTNALYQSADTPLGKVPEFSDEELDREIGKWKGGVWKIKNYVASINSLRDYMRPGRGADRASIESMVGDYITGELWRAEIKAKGYETRPEVVKAANRATEETVVSALHDQLIKDVKVDDETVKAFYDEHKAEMMTEPGARIAIIVLKDEAEAKAVYDQLKGGTKFETLARQKSADVETGKDGGELARPLYRQEIEQFPDVQEVLNNLQVGAYSTPIEIPPGFGAEGYMMIKLLERIEARQMELAEIKEMLTPQVLQLEQDKAFAAWLKSKMEEHKVEIYPDALNAVDFTQLKNQGT